MEGVVALFRAALVIFIALEKRLRGIYTIENFIKAVHSYVSSIKNVKQFQNHMNEIYINRDILDRIRSTLYQIKHQHMARLIIKNKPVEDCNDNSPYCFESDEFLHVNDSDFIIRVNNLIGNLKVSYFNPFYGKKLVDKLNKLSLPPLAKKRGDAKVRYSVMNPHDFDLVEAQKLQILPLKQPRISNAITHSLFKDLGKDDRLSDVLDQLLQDDSMSRFENTVDIEPDKKVVDEQALVNRGSSLSGLSCFNDNKDNRKQTFITIHNSCHDVLCFRTKHVCTIEDIESENQNILERLKRNFFNKVATTIINYLGSSIANYLRRKKYHTKNHQKKISNQIKVNPLTLKTTYKLRRTSFDVKKQKRFLSLNLRRPKHFEIGFRRRKTNINLPFTKRLSFNDMSMQNKRDPFLVLENHDNKTMVDDFFDTFDKRYKLSINDYRDSKSPGVRAEKVGIRQFI